MEACTSARLGPVMASIEVALILLVAGPGAAHATEASSSLRLAYIDPATGSLIIQAVLGVLAASVVTARLYWTKIKGWLGLASAKQADDGDLTPGVSPETPPKDG